MRTQSVIATLRVGTWVCDLVVIRVTSLRSLEASLYYMRRSDAKEQRVAKALQLPKRLPVGELEGNGCDSRYFARPRFSDRGSRWESRCCWGRA